MSINNLLNVAIALICILESTVTLPAQVTTLYTLNGFGVGDMFGSWVCGADVNKDGYPDIIGGSRGASPGSIPRAGQVLVFSGKDGGLLYTFNGLGAGDMFGRWVGGADVNKDGHADIISGAHFADPGSLSNAGQTTVFSGKDGSVLYTFNGLVAGDEFGRSVAGVDVNNDGYADIIVGAHGALSHAGQVRVFSGKDGSVLYTCNGMSPGGWLGEELDVAGDVNKDGFADFIVGARHAGGGQALVYSGKDGSVLHTFNGNGQFGYAVSGAGDVDRDGYADLIVGAWQATVGSLSSAGQAFVFSGKNGNRLFTFNGLASGDTFGQFVASTGDVDRDGYPDLIVGATKADPGNLSSAGRARVFSGKNGKVLHTLNGLAAGDNLGHVGTGCDINRDGFPDLLVGAPEADAGSISDSGQAYVFSVATTSIYGSGSPGIGGTITLNLLAPGGSLSYLVGSSLGTGPIHIDNRQLGLSPDDLLVVSVNGWWPSIFIGYRGVIDSKGQAKGAINIPNISPLIGQKIHTAFVTLSPSAPSGIKSISNTFSFTITK